MASFNRTHKTNAAKGIDNSYNEYKEFHERETEAHICTAFMEMAHISTLKGYLYISKCYYIFKLM
jgi:hypothetical protein